MTTWYSVVFNDKYGESTFYTCERERALETLLLYARDDERQLTSVEFRTGTWDEIQEKGGEHD